MLAGELDARENIANPCFDADSVIFFHWDFKYRVCFHMQFDRVFVAKDFEKTEENLCRCLCSQFFQVQVTLEEDGWCVC